MANRIIAVVALLAFTNMIAGGCTKMVKYQLEGPRFLNNDKIIAVTLLSGEKIEFDNLGGRYVADDDQVVGVKTDGTRDYWQIDELKEITVIDLAADEPLPTVFEARQYKAASDVGKPTGITEVVTTSGDRVKFATWSGKVDNQKRAVVGFDRNRNPIEVPFDEIDYVRCTKTDTVALVAGILVATAVIVGLCSMDWDWGPDLSGTFDN